MSIVKMSGYSVAVMLINPSGLFFIPWNTADTTVSQRKGIIMKTIVEKAIAVCQRCAVI